MYSIQFLQDVQPIKKAILSGKIGIGAVEEIFAQFETYRTKQPIVFNIETSNNCNMRCIMCPRTKLMTRQVQNIDDAVFASVLEQLSPHSEPDLTAFSQFVQQEHAISTEEQSEDHFYFYLLPHTLVLHGFGEPLIDRAIVKRVQACQKQGIPTYFSCVPANINVTRIEELMASGLGMLKLSIDALDDEKAQAIRGKHNNYESAQAKIIEILNLKEKHGYQTRIVTTMINMGTSDNDLTMQQNFLRTWRGHGTYSYVKSLDNRWMNNIDSELVNQSHYMSQYCEYPWTSMTVLANGNVVPCTQDYNGELVMGNVREQSLDEIWNSAKYAEFRRMHITGKFTCGHKCQNRCDLPKLYQRLEANDKKASSVDCTESAAIPATGITASR